jgi:hypothetical protein
MTPRLSDSVAVVCAVTLLALTACNGDNTPAVTAPVPTRASTTTIDPTDPTTTSTTSTTTTSTVADSTPDTTIGTGDGFLPADLGPRLDSVPGVNTPGELIEIFDNVVMFIPSEPDPNDLNVQPPLPEDRDILIAYANASAAVYEQSVQNPVPVEPSERMKSTFLDRGEGYRPVFEQLNRDGQHLDFQFGIDIDRPIVIAEPRSETEAFVFSCNLVASVYVNIDGTLAEGETPGVDRQPLITQIVKQDDGTWIVGGVQGDDRACI